MKREAGILLPVTALPSPWGVGGLSKHAYRFVDFLAEAGQRYWQILPMGPTGYGDSPYQSFSAFAGNPYWIDPEELISEGLLSYEECELYGGRVEEGRVDYGALYARRIPLLRRAFERGRGRFLPEVQAFRESNRDWLEDYALFMACKEDCGGAPLREWESSLRLREQSALADRRNALKDEIEFHVFIQAKFFAQWNRLKQYANGKGIQIIGDLPIYVSADSADLWCHPELFRLDEQGAPTVVAGCPPDEFSKTGQLWGNPLYDWDAHRATGYRWWIDRLRHALNCFDAVRIDHFRGFDEYYSVDANASTAESGRWERGPGIGLFRAMEETLGKRDIIAEDLGFITDSVRELLRQSGFDGMRVLQMGVSGEDSFESDHLPHAYPPECVAYTGTHDNPTLREWLESLSEEKEKQLRAYLWDEDTPKEALCGRLIALVMRSAARRCIIPIQDYLELGERGCMNRPSTQGENWRWQLGQEELSEELQRKILRLTRIGGR